MMSSNIKPPLRKVKKKKTVGRIEIAPTTIFSFNQLVRLVKTEKKTRKSGGLISSP